jgi:hypothetical protein
MPAPTAARTRDPPGRGLGGADGVLEPVGAAEPLRERGVLDAGAVEQLEQLPGIGPGGRGPRLDVRRGGHLPAGLDL